MEVATSFQSCNDQHVEHGNMTRPYDEIRRESYIEIHDEQGRVPQMEARRTDGDGRRRDTGFPSPELSLGGMPLRIDGLAHLVSAIIGSGKQRSGTETVSNLGLYS
jgi:hypothetical protein